MGLGFCQTTFDTLRLLTNSGLLPPRLAKFYHQWHICNCSGSGLLPAVVWGWKACSFCLQYNWTKVLCKALASIWPCKTCHLYNCCSILRTNHHVLAILLLTLVKGYRPLRRWSDMLQQEHFHSQSLPCGSTHPVSLHHSTQPTCGYKEWGTISASSLLSPETVVRIVGCMSSRVSIYHTQTH